ncbi:MAG: hypothetical protein IFNCLDLE_02683 [Ignavibacteriaceae bacterium]|nr:hypothetical protein [Ignavibacteriaceae bacterium]
MLDAYAIFSTHAKERLKESNVSVSKAAYMLYNAEKEKLDKNLRQYKNKRYGDEEQLFYRYGTFIFTLRKIKDKYSGDECYLVLTVTDQRLTLHLYK